MRKLACALCSFVALVASPAEAYDWATEVYITAIEPTYMPKYINVMIDRPVGSCGSWLVWNGMGNNDGERWDNNRSMFAALLAAQMARTRVRIHGSNSGCRLEFIHILQN